MTRRAERPGADEPFPSDSFVSQWKAWAFLSISHALTRSYAPVLALHPMIELTHEPIDSSAVLAAVASTRAGAVVLFLGTTRAWTDGRETATLDYECYPEMAGRALSDLDRQARERWPLEEVAIVHRLGRVDPGEASVAIAVSSPHREQAFEAGKWLIDTLKECVPIWKKENWADGSVEWVHPEADAGKTMAEKESGS